MEKVACPLFKEGNTGYEMRNTRYGEKGAAAVVMSIIVITVLLTLIGGLVLLTSTGYKSYHFSKDRAQALYLAEAGISSAIQEIKGDGYLPEDYYDEEGEEGIGSVPQTSLGDGSYSVDCTAIMPSRGGVQATSEHGSLGDLDVPRYYEYQFTSTGEIYGVSRQAQATYEVRIDIKEFKHIASYTDSCNIAGAELTQVLPVPLMDFFWDSADYKYTTDTVLSGELEGIHYVKGNARLEQGATLKGTIVVDGGELTIEKECEINPSKNPDPSKQDFPAIVVYGTSGNVVIEKGTKNKETEINGLVYASNSVETNKNCNIKGVIIGEEITVGQNNEIEYEEVSPPGFWGGTSNSGGTTRKVSLESGTWQSS